MIKNCPFNECRDNFRRPILPIKIINPHTNLFLSTYGIIDTGADECAVPATYASILGHDLKKGKARTIGTGGGDATSYPHTTTLEIIHPKTYKLVCRIENAQIDFMVGLPEVLLGVGGFLSNFILNINYPKSVFSLTKPKKRK